MNDGKVIRLSVNQTLPEDVIEALLKRLAEWENIYVIAEKKDGSFAAFGSGALKTLSDAAIYMNELASDHVRDRLEKSDV